MLDVWLLFFVSLILSYSYEKYVQKVHTNGYVERCDTSQSRMIYFVLVVVLVLFAGLRTRMNDTLNYVAMFQNSSRVPSGIPSLFSVDWKIGSNPFFVIFLRFIKTIFGEKPQIMIFITSIIIEVSCLKFLHRYSPNFCISIFTFMGFVIYGFTLAAMKQALSIAIGIWAIPQIIEGRKIKAILILLFAAMIHPYIIILCMFVFLKDDIWNKRTVLILIITLVCAVSFGSFGEFVLGISDAFGEEYTQEVLIANGVGIARVISYLFIPVMSFIYRNEIREQNNQLYNICINASLVASCFIVLASFGGANFIGRMPYYLDLLTCISAAVIFGCTEHKNKRIFAALFVMLMLVYYFTYYNKYCIGYCGGNWFEDIYSHVSLMDLF